MRNPLNDTVGYLARLSSLPPSEIYTLLGIAAELLGDIPGAVAYIEAFYI